VEGRAPADPADRADRVVAVRDEAAAVSDVAAITFVDPDEAPAPTNILLYGPPGSGKSVAACSAPGPVVVLNAEGPGALRFARRKFGNGHIREVEFIDEGTLRNLSQYLESEKGRDTTIVVDSLGEVYEGLLREVSGGGTPQLQHYGTVNKIVKDFVRYLRNFPAHVVIVCHEQIDDSDEGGATRRPLTGGSKLPEAVMGMMDVVAYCSAVPGEKNEDPVQYVGQVIQGRGRRAKDRSGGLGPWRELDLTEWIAVIDETLRPDDLPWEQPALDEVPS
jgi:hypothetical protein